MRCRNCFRDLPLDDNGRCGRCIAEMIKMRAEARLPEIINEAIDRVGASPELKVEAKPDRSHCRGCVDNFYNGNNPYNVRTCWSLKDAKLVTRWRLPVWQEPTARGAFEEAEVYDCRREKGYVLYQELPVFAIDPIRLRVSEEVKRGL